MSDGKLKIDWRKIERDVTERIRLLEVADRGIQHTEIGAKIQHDMIVPAVGLLVQFVECVHVDEGDDDGEGLRDHPCFTQDAGALRDCESDGWCGCAECTKRK